MCIPIFFHRIVRPCLFVVAALILHASSALAQENPGIRPPTSKPYGVSFTGWGEMWSSWAFATPVNQNPLLDPDGRFCHVGQSGQVFFLGNTVLGIPTLRSCTIDPGLSVLIPAGGSLCILNLDADTEAGLQQCVEEGLASIAEVSADVDGVPVENIDSYLTEISPLFSFTLPADNVLGLPAGEYQARTAGWTLVTTPLRPGEHVIHFHDEVPAASLVFDVTYHLTVRVHQ